MKWIPALTIIASLSVAYAFNFVMTADKMFLQPEVVSFKGRNEHTLGDSAVVLVVQSQGEAKAYPIRYIIYHHQVRDIVGEKEVMVTYCSVCRTGRVYDPIVKGEVENFRLVGMDHFNAMFEDGTTKSWWQQSTGVAVAGSLKGEVLPEIESKQMTVRMFFNRFPFGLLMQADDASTESYDSLGKYEQGKSKGQLTKTDSVSWLDKSWVIGVQHGNKEKAFDWIELSEKGVLNETIGDTPIVIALSSDGQSFVAYERTTDQEIFSIRNDTLIAGKKFYDWSGRSVEDPKDQLEIVTAYQEFWHSWRTFHPNSEVRK
jgi:hypothetical protein